MDRKYQFEIVDLADYQLINAKHDKSEGAERARLKARLNALGMQGYRFIHYHKLSSTVWMQKEVDE